MSSIFQRLQEAASFITQTRRDAALNRAKYESLAKQIPILHISLIANTGMIAWSFGDLAPAFLTIWIPGSLIAFCSLRLVLWLVGGNKPIDDATVHRRLRSSTILAGFLGVFFFSWAASLYPYGGLYEQAQLAFYMSVTVLGCYLCLTHLPVSSLLLFLTVILPFSIFFGSSGIPAFVHMAINMFFVSVTMAFVSLQYYRDFVALVTARESLIERQSETQRLSDENFRLANMDALTGLPNRRRFFAELEEILATAQAGGTKVAIGLIDLDGFKPVNDVYGHACGDELLVQVAARLTPLCGPSNVFARLGGDEFGVIVRDVRSQAQLLELGHVLTRALQQPFDMPRIRVQIAGSVGFAVFPEAAQSGAQLFERADYALYHAKEANRGSVVLFSREHEVKIREQSFVARHLRSADLDAELWVAFHPIVDTHAGRTIGFEALARWRSPALGDVAPDVFVRLAERYNMVSELTYVLLRKALVIAADLPEHLRVSFSLSTFDLASPDAMGRIVDVVKAASFPANRIDFEITETAVFVDFEQARRSVDALKALGARISLDDFGRGYSSLAYVQKLPLDRIKIDRGFVAEIENDRASRDIVKTIADLCRNLELDCVGEGVETFGQLRALHGLGCHLVQGFLFAEPMPAHEVAAYLMRELAQQTATGPEEAADVA